jgi:hypothetical protein
MCQRKISRFNSAVAAIAVCVAFCSCGVMENKMNAIADESAQKFNTMVDNARTAEDARGVCLFLQDHGNGFHEIRRQIWHPNATCSLSFTDINLAGKDRKRVQDSSRVRKFRGTDEEALRLVQRSRSADSCFKASRTDV